MKRVMFIVIFLLVFIIGISFVFADNIDSNKSVCGNGICEPGEANHGPSCLPGQGCPEYIIVGTCPQDCNGTVVAPGPVPAGCEKGKTWDSNLKQCINCSSGTEPYLDGPVWKCRKAVNGTLVGNDSDSHGCIGSAGYQWCEEKQKCIRPWEENCSSVENNTFPGEGKVKILPETASLRARERLGELGFNVTLKEVGAGNQTRSFYEVAGEKEGKMFGLFKVKGKVSVDVDAQTGEVLMVHKPWWGFMAGI